MAFDSSLLVEEEQEGFDSNLLVEEEESPLERSARNLEELRAAIEEHRTEKEDKLTSRELTPVERFRASTIGQKLLGPTGIQREGMVSGGAPAPGKIAETMLKFTTLPPQVAEPVRDLTEMGISKLSPVTAGVTRGLRETAFGIAGGFPAGALMNPRLVAAPFAAQYLTTVPEQFEAVEQAAMSGDKAALAEGITTLGLGALATGAGTAYGFKKPQFQPGELQGKGGLIRSAAPEGYNVEPSYIEGPDRPITLGTPEIRVSPEVARRPLSGMDLVKEQVPKTLPTGEIPSTPEMRAVLEEEALRKEILSRQAPVEGPDKPISLGMPEIRVSPEIAARPPSGIEIAREPVPKAPVEGEIKPTQEMVEMMKPGGIIAGSKLEAWADRILGEDPRSRTNLNPVDILAKQIPALAVKGAAVIERGIRSFAEWSTEMIREFGEEIKPLLREIYAQSMGMKGAKDASSVKEAAKQEAPTQEGGQRPTEPAGARPDQAPAGEAKGGLLLEEAPPAVLPGAIELAKQYEGKLPELEKLAGEAKAASAKARDEAIAAARKSKDPSLMDTPELQELMTRKQATEEAVMLLKKAEPEKTATFSGMQLGLPQFRYKDPATGRFNDVSAETAQKRGYSISPEESAKAKAAQNPRSAEAAFIDVGAVAEAATKGVEAVATNLRARGNLPPEAFAAKEAASGEIQRADKVIKQLGGDLMKELGKVYGLNFLQKAAGGSRKIPAVDVQRMDAYLKGDHSQGPAINPNVRGVLDNMRATITGLSERVIHELQAQGGNDPLVQRIQDNLDVYVTRSYKFFDSKKPADKWYFELPDSVRNAAEQFAQQPRPNGTIPTPEEARASIMNWLSDLKDNASQRQSGSLGSKDLSQFMKRGTITTEMRAVLGEYKDPLTNFAKSTTKMTDWLANQQFLNDVKDAGLGRWIYPEGQAPPGFNVKIAAEGSDTMSPLNGMRTSPEIAKALQDIRGQRGNPSWYAKAWYTLNAITKSAATTQSVLTQARNAWGQPFFAGMGGYWHVGKFPDALRAIITDVGFNANQTRRVYLQNAAKRGVINDSPRAAELMEILKDANLNDINTPGDLTSFSLARLAKKAYFKLPAEIYKIADDLGKLYYWENEKVNVRKVHPAWTPEQVDIEGAARVRNFVPTYSKAGAAIRGLRKWPISPFPSFFSEVIRTSFNAMGQSISELRSANPIERSIGAKRFASQLATLSAGYALSAFTRSMFNVSKQEEEDLRRFQPSWSKNSQFVFTGREKGKLNFVNFSYQNPYSQLIDPLISVASSVNNDTPFVEAAAGAVGEFFRPFVSEEMLTAALIDAKRGETFTGRKVWDDIDPPGVKAWKGADHIAMTFAPGTVQRLRKRIIPAFTKEQPPYGRKLEPTREVLSEISGIRAESFDFQNGLAFKARQFREDIQEAEGKFRSPAHEPSTPPGTLIDKYRQAQEMRYGLWSELRKDYLAALRSGISTNDATRAIMAMDLSKTMAGSVQNGVYVPWVPGDETLGRIPKANLPPLVEAIKATVKEYKGKGPK